MSATEPTSLPGCEQPLSQHVGEQAVLYALTERLHRAGTLQEIYAAALDSIQNALGCDCAAILLFEEGSVMRFVAWRGLSDGYRQAVEGHSPWQTDDKNPQPIGIDDVALSDLPEPLKAVITAEGLRALAFIPLTADGRLIGKFMLYYQIPHRFTGAEFDLALTIGRQLAFCVQSTRIEAQRQQLEKEQALFAAIVQSSEDAIVSKDLNGIVTSWNAAAERIYGWKAEEIIGRSKALVMPPDMPNELSSILDKIRAGERIRHYETRRLRKDGVIIDVAVSVSPVKDPQGRIIGAATIVRDITEHKRTERELKRRQAEVEALNERLKRAMQETHHRIKNNLQIISAMIDMQSIDYLQERAVPLKELERLGNHIRTLAIVHDLLTRSLREDEEEQRVSSAAVIGQLLGLLEKTGGGYPIQYHVDDVELLSKQAVTISLTINELISNAVKHANGKVEVTFQAHDRMAELSVCDDGAGFPEGFDPMIHAHTGLELVLSLVETDLKGQIYFENRDVGGACVRVAFPLPKNSGDALEGAPPLERQEK